MKLAITLTITHAILKFSIPSPGTYYVWTGIESAKIVCANHVSGSCYAAVTLARESDLALYHVTFFPDKH